MSNDKGKILLSALYYVIKDNNSPIDKLQAVQLIFNLNEICTNGAFEKYIQHVALSEEEKETFDKLYNILAVDFSQYFDLVVILESYEIFKAKSGNHPSKLVLALTLSWIIYVKTLLLSDDATKEHQLGAISIMFSELISFFENVDDIIPSDINSEESQEILGFYYMNIYEIWAKIANWLSFERYYNDYEEKKALPLSVYHSRYISETKESQPNSSQTDDYSEQTSSKQGCYIATCVYGGYDCPEVWLLRRFRDDYLRKNLFGRLFVKIYYTFSPYLVKKLGHLALFKTLSGKCLSPLVKTLRDRGVSDSPYSDK